MTLLLLFTLITKRENVILLVNSVNPNHDQFPIDCDDHEACCRNTQQASMELDGFWFSVMQFQQFSNYLLLVGGPRVKQIIITPTKKVQNSAKCRKSSGAVDISKNGPIMHKTVALREEPKIFRGNQLTQDD